MVTQRCVCVEVFKSYLPDVNFKNDLQKDLTYEPEDGTAVKNSVALNRATLYLSTFEQQNVSSTPIGQEKIISCSIINNITRETQAGMAYGIL